MAITYKYSEELINDLTSNPVYIWDVYKDGKIIDIKRAIPVKDVRPDIWDKQQAAIKKSTQEKLLALGFSPEEANLICSGQD
jgi:hypothetical protein